MAIVARKEAFSTASTPRLTGRRRVKRDRNPRATLLGAPVEALVSGRSDARAAAVAYGVTDFHSKYTDSYVDAPIFLTVTVTGSECHSSVPGPMDAKLAAAPGAAIEI